MKFNSIFPMPVGLTLLLGLVNLSSTGATGQAQPAQAQPAESKPAESKPAETTHAPGMYRVFYLTNLAQPNDATDIQTSLRNMLQTARIYYVASQGAITVFGSPEDIQLAQKIVADLDRVKKIYRLTFTVTDIDTGKRTGAQQYAMIVDSGGKTVFKQGSRMPIVTGSYDVKTLNANSQVQYLDVGLMIEASVEGYIDGMRLHAKVEQSSLSDEKSSIGVQDPILRQTELDQTSMLTPGKPLVLGSLDIPGTTRRQEIAVVSELVP
jgi:type II secretory pathway component GspD/PulD (secretin)